MKAEYIKIIADNRLYHQTDGLKGALAELSGANLTKADLRRDNLREADLSEADLSRADLNGGELRGADLRGADLRGAELNGAELAGANLSGADLSGATGVAPITESAITELLWIAETILACPESLEMESVHTCNTTHCGAGWVCFHNPIAATLEKIVGWNAAACLACPIPEFTSLFYSSNEEMLAFLKSVEDDSGQALREKYLTGDTHHD